MAGPAQQRPRVVRAGDVLLIRRGPQQSTGAHSQTSPAAAQNASNRPGARTTAAFAAYCEPEKTALEALRKRIRAAAAQLAEENSKWNNNRKKPRKVERMAALEKLQTNKKRRKVTHTRKRPEKLITAKPAPTLITAHTPNTPNANQQANEALLPASPARSAATGRQAQAEAEAEQ
jgi:hypothetical protein